MQSAPRLISKSQRIASSVKDGHPDTVGHRVDFAQLIKVYRTPQGGEVRYSPAEVASTEVVPVCGNPDSDRICTSIVERQNLTIKMKMRRLTRITNAFSKKWENLWAVYCLHFAYYNFPPDSSHVARYARDGIEHCRSRLDD